jgi:hypothetical protein
MIKLSDVKVRPMYRTRVRAEVSFRPSVPRLKIGDDTRRAARAGPVGLEDAW